MTGWRSAPVTLPQLALNGGGSLCLVGADHEDEAHGEHGDRHVSVIHMFQVIVNLVQVLSPVQIHALRTGLKASAFNTRNRMLAQVIPVKGKVCLLIM